MRRGHARPWRSPGPGTAGRAEGGIVEGRDLDERTTAVGVVEVTERECQEFCGVDVRAVGFGHAPSVQGYGGWARKQAGPENTQRTSGDRNAFPSGPAAAGPTEPTSVTDALGGTGRGLPSGRQGTCLPEVGDGPGEDLEQSPQRCRPYSPPGSGQRDWARAERLAVPGVTDTPLCWVRPVGQLRTAEGLRCRHGSDLYRQSAVGSPASWRMS